MTQTHLALFSSKLTLLGCVLLFLTIPLLGQKEKKRKTDPEILSSARLSEAESVFIEGEKFFILEDYSKALIYFLRASELNPNSATIFYKLAEALSKSTKDEDLRKAVITIDQAIKLDKKNKYYYLLASNINNNLGQFSKSASVMEAMLKEVPETEEYLYELATIYLFDKKEEEALKTYNRVENVLGIHEISSLQKQRIYLDKGKIPEAIAEGEKLVRAFPEEERYVMALAEILAQNKQFDKAILIIENYLKETPDSPSSKMLLSGLYRDAGQEQKARAYIINLFDDPHLAVSSKVLMIGSYNAALAQGKSKGKEEDKILFFGRVSPIKRVETLISAIPLIQDKKVKIVDI